jgi:hypothetical protein
MIATITIIEWLFSLFSERYFNLINQISKLIIIDVDKYCHIPILYGAYKKVRETR